MDNQVQSQGPLRVENAADLLLVLLYAPGKSEKFAEPITGTTRLQKLFFLLRQGEGPRQLVQEASEFDFAAYKMGPFSSGLRDTIADLVAAGIVKIERLDFLLPDDSDRVETEGNEDERGSGRATAKEVTSFRYSLSPDLGMQIGSDLWLGLGDDLQSAVAEFKRFFNSISLRQLLIFTYEKYPEYTTRSTIKDQLGF